MTSTEQPRRTAAHQARVVDLRQGSRTSRYSHTEYGTRRQGSRSAATRAAVNASIREQV